MKRLNYLLFVLALVMNRCSSSKDHQHHDEHKQEVKKVYTCPMHPEIMRDKPGKCPICGMDLVEKVLKAEHHQDTSLKFLLMPTNQFVLSKIKTIHMQEKELPVEFTATGSIFYDTRFINTVSVRAAGRVEKLYVKYRFQPISKGQKLMDIYSKDIVTEQENYIFLLNNDSDNEAMINAAETKLGLLGLNKEQISELKKTRKKIEYITIYSPYTGHLHDMSPTKKLEGMDNDKMEAQDLSIREGMYVKKGQTIFNIYCTDKVWAVLNIYPENQDILRRDQSVKLLIDGLTDSVAAKIDFIEPVMRQDQKTIAARVYLNNYNDRIKIGAVVKAIGATSKTQGSFIPADAVLSLGLNDVVFVRREKLFEAVPVKLGMRTNGWVEILSGLDRSEQISANAQLLMDSEAFIKTRK